MVVALQLLVGVVVLVTDEPVARTSLDSGLSRRPGAAAPVLPVLPPPTSSTLVDIPAPTVPVSLPVPTTLPRPRIPVSRIVPPPTELGHGGTYVLAASGLGLTKVLDLGDGWAEGGWINNDREFIVRVPTDKVSAFDPVTRTMRVLYDRQPLTGPILLSPDRQRIALSVASGLVVVDLESLSTVSWKFGPAFHAQAWHPTEPRILAREGNEPPEMVDIDVLTGERRVLHSGTTSGLWSPDGRKIVTNDNTGVWLVPVDQPSSKTRISENLFEQPIGWVDDTILFYVGDDTAGLTESGQRREVFASTNTKTPVWSSTAKTFAALVKERNESETEWGYSLESMAIDGSDRKMLVEKLPDTDLYSAMFYLWWSQSGTRLAFTANRGLRRN